MVVGSIPRMGKTFAARRLASLDQHQNRRRTSWHRWTTLAILAAPSAPPPRLTATVLDPTGLIPLPANKLYHLFTS